MASQRNRSWLDEEKKLLNRWCQMLPMAKSGVISVFVNITLL